MRTNAEPKIIFTAHKPNILFSYECPPSYSTLSNSVSVVLKNFGPPAVTATAVFCDMFDKFVDCFKCQKHHMEHVTEQKPF